VVNKRAPGRTKEPQNIEGLACVPVNGTAVLLGWTGRTSFPARYFGTVIEEREAHWPKGQVMAKLSSHTTVSPVDVCNVQLSRSY
jgi:hypothetical protein